MIKLVKLLKSQVPCFITNLVKLRKKISIDSNETNKDDVFLFLPLISKSREIEIQRLEKVIERGFEKVVVQKETVRIIRELEEKVQTLLPILIEVENTRSFYSTYARSIFPLSPPTLVGITGTNGKSSTVDLISQVWHSLGHTSASIGTLGVKIYGPKISNFLSQRRQLTTPDALDLHRVLNQFSLSGVKRVCLEASSHGLSQGRMDAINFQMALFTGLSHDHLDFHRNYRNYFKSKKHLFSKLLKKDGIAILNRDDIYYEDLERVCKGRRIRIVSYGKKGKEIVQDNFKAISSGFLITWYIFGRRYRVSVPLFGDFYAKNLTAAIAATVSIGDPIDQIIESISNLSVVPGRMDLVGYHPLSGAPIFIDYAHTPEALKLALLATRSYTRGNLRLVFGCGGDRDKRKRSIMGKIASQLADFTYITDDNPRTEDPGQIREEILKTCQGASEIPDRKVAIMQAIISLCSGDSCLITGKGHEVNQIVGNKIIRMNDREIISDILFLIQEEVMEEK